MFLSIKSLLLPTVILLPLIGALLIWLADSMSSRKVALYVSLVTFVLSTILLVFFDHLSAEPFSYVSHYSLSWRSLVLFSFSIGIDSLSLWMILLTTLLFPICVLCSWGNPNLINREFMAIMLILESMLLAIWSVLDLLLFYILYESVLIPLFFLIGFGGSRQRKIRAAYLLVLYTFIGSLVMLPTVLAIYSEAGTTDYELLVHTGFSLDRQKVLWWGLFLAFAVKIPMLPFHIWLPEAHVEAPTAGSVLLAGVLLKLGGYGFLRYSLCLLPEACDYYSPVVITMSLIALIYASLTTLRQVDLKKLIAYSSVAHMSLVTLGIFCLNDLSSSAAVFLMISHGIVSPALFLLVGSLYDRYHTKLFKHLGGMSQTMPIFSVFFFLFTLANMAIPLFPNFIAEFITMCGVLRYHLWATLVSCLGVILSAAYSLWAYARVVHGVPKPQYISAFCDLNRREFWVLFPLLVVTLWLGINSSPLLMSLEQYSLGSIVY